MDGTCRDAALLVPTTGKTYLFTGDTLFLGRDNQWQAGFIEGIHTEEHRPVLAGSLRLLRELEPDVVFGSAYTGDHGFYGSWPDKVEDAALQRLG